MYPIDDLLLFHIDKINSQQQYAFLPEGIGRNGVVFETKRPDDPKVFANRFKDQMAQREYQVLIKNLSYFDGKGFGSD